MLPNCALFTISVALTAYTANSRMAPEVAGTAGTAAHFTYAIIVHSCTAPLHVLNQSSVGSAAVHATVQ
jgi:hypothetical protein